jgi:hypothetical protein
VHARGPESAERGLRRGIPIDIDPSLYPNISELHRVGLRTVDAHLGRRRFRVWIFEKLSDREPPLFSTSYQERVEVELGDRWVQLWVRTDLPWETGDSVDACMRAALTHVDGA